MADSLVRMLMSLPLTLVWIILTVILLIIVNRIISKIFRKGCKHLPTPDENRAWLYFNWLIRTWYKGQDFKIANFELLQQIVDRNRKYGMFHFRIPGILDYLLLFDGRTVQPILDNAQMVRKDDFYAFFRPWLGHALFANPGDTWRQRRKLLTPAFHFRILDNFLTTMDEHSRNLVKSLNQSKGEDWVDIVTFMANCSLDTLCETAMGIGAKAQNEERTRFFRSMMTVCEMIVQRVFHVWASYDFIFYLTSEGKKFKQHVNSMDKYILQVIEERKSALEHKREEEVISMNSDENYFCGKKRKPFLDIILDCHFNNPDFTLDNVREEVSSLMFGGLETTTYTGSWTLYLLGKHPEIQRKVQKEMDEIFEDDPCRAITGEDLRKMKYTDCVIKESMRLYPAGPVTGRTITESINCCGYTIPKGTHCVVLIYHVHRDPKVFPEPEVFNPDRFLLENSLGRNPYSYIPFSAGIRNCIGQRFALMELKTVLANVLRNFDLESLDNHVQPVLSVILRPYGPLRLRVKRRSKTVGA